MLPHRINHAQYRLLGIGDIFTAYALYQHIPDMTDYYVLFLETVVIKPKVTS